MPPTRTKAQLRTAQRMREIDSPPTSVNFSMSVKAQSQGSVLFFLKSLEWFGEKLKFLKPCIFTWY